MNKFLVFCTVFLLTFAFASAVANPVDPYADAVEKEYRVHNAQNAVGAPDGDYAKVKGFGYLILDMGEGEEIYGGPYDAIDFKVIEVDGREIPDCASIGVWIADEGFEWVGLSCSSDGFELPEGSVVRYVKIANFVGTSFEVDAVEAEYYLPNNVPEFGILAAFGVLALAGLFIYKRRN